MSWREEQLKVMAELDPRDPAVTRERRRSAIAEQMGRLPQVDHNGIPVSAETLEGQVAERALELLGGGAEAVAAVDAARAAGGDALAQLWADVSEQVGSERG